MASAHTPRSVPQALIGKISALAPARIAEVEDFVDFIAHRDGAKNGSDRALTSAAAAASAPAFAAVWTNPEDDVYDAL
jgi:hypothetical protein